MFLHLSVSHSVILTGTPPGQVTPPGKVHPPGQVHPLAGTPPGRYTPMTGTPQWQVHPRQIQPPPCAVHAGIQQAGGTHPTGMQSCNLVVFIISITI